MKHQNNLQTSFNLILKKMEKRIHELQTFNQLLTLLQHSIQETLEDSNSELSESTINNLARSHMSLEGEKLRAQREISRLHQL